MRLSLRYCDFSVKSKIEFLISDSEIKIFADFSGLIKEKILIHVYSNLFIYYYFFTIYFFCKNMFRFYYMPVKHLTPMHSQI